MSLVSACVSSVVFVLGIIEVLTASETNTVSIDLNFVNFVSSLT